MLSREDECSSDGLNQLQNRIIDASEHLLIAGDARYVDFVVTKQWMHTILWQISLSQGLLSFRSAVEAMKYSYPRRIMRDLLQYLPEINKNNFVAGGQDQVR